MINLDHVEYWTDPDYEYLLNPLDSSSQTAMIGYNNSCFTGLVEPYYFGPVFVMFAMNWT